MGNIFDTIQDNMFDTVTATMGDSATWQPDGSDTTYEATVLYKEPTEPTELADRRVDFNPQIRIIEYRKGFFPELFEKVQQAVTDEYIFRKGVRYLVQYAEAKFDGKTYKLYVLERPE